MVLIIMLAAVWLSVCLVYKSWPRKMNRADRLGLDSYDEKSRCEGAFPFDYLSR